MVTSRIRPLAAAIVAVGAGVWSGPAADAAPIADSRLAVWYDAADLANDGGAGNLSNGTALTTWKDRSGNGFDLVVPAQPAGVGGLAGQVQAPTYATAAQNGLPVVQFRAKPNAGNGNFTAMNTAPGNSPSPEHLAGADRAQMTIFAVVKQIHTSAGARVWAGYENVSTAPPGGTKSRFAFQANRNDGTNFVNARFDAFNDITSAPAGAAYTAGSISTAVSAGGANNNVTTGPLASASGLVLVTGVKDAVGSWLYEAGNVLDGSQANNASALAEGTTRLVLGANRDANDGGFRSPGNFDMAELLIYNRALTAAEINTVNGYLAGKWGTPFTPLVVPEPSGAIACAAIAAGAVCGRRRRPAGVA